MFRYADVHSFKTRNDTSSLYYTASGIITPLYYTASGIITPLYYTDSGIITSIGVMIPEAV